MGVPYAEVIGDPIAHSKSPLIHNFWLEKLGMKGEYRATRVTAEELSDFLAERRSDPDWRGCNVTEPHKQAVVEHLDTIARHASALGAVNAIRRGEDGRLHGRNTDVHGVWRSLDDQAKPNMRIALIGAGGAARAAAFALQRRSAPEFVLINRTEERARTLMNDLGLNGRVSSVLEIPAVDLVVNTSSGPTPTDLSNLGENAVVFDMVYDPLETPLLRAARKRHLKTIDGLVMLVNQATEAFATFFKRSHPEGSDRELRELLTR